MASQDDPRGHGFDPKGKNRGFDFKGKNRGFVPAPSKGKADMPKPGKGKANDSKTAARLAVLQRRAKGE